MLQQVIKSNCGFCMLQVPIPVQPSLSFFVALSLYLFWDAFPWYFWLLLGHFPLIFLDHYLLGQQFIMKKGKYKDTVLTKISTYWAWLAIFIAKYKTKNFLKYVDGLTIILNPDLWHLFSTTTTTRTKTNNTILIIDIAEVEIYFNKKEAYKVEFE